jgi:hypothetical protein
MKETKDKYDQIYNWKISMSDILYQVRYLIAEEGATFELGSPEGQLAAMKHLGFDITKGYNITKDYTHRNIRDDIVTCGFIEGFANKPYLEKHGIKPIEYMIQPDVNDTVHEELKSIFDNGILEDKTVGALPYGVVAEDVQLEDIESRSVPMSPKKEKPSEQS